jgi:hypothetical protein
MAEEKKFLDQTGVQYLWSKLSLEDYPNNRDLITVINAIDETKADKDELFSGSWNDLTDKPFGEKENWTIISDNYSRPMILIPIESDTTNGLTNTGTYKFTINNKDVYLYEKNQEGAISDIYIGD